MSDVLWGQYERLRPAQVDAIKQQYPIAYLPWGALEWHSYHNAIGLDALKAHQLMCRLAQREGGLVLPPVFVGTDTIKPFKGFKHTLDYTPELVRMLMEQTLDQLVDEGFKLIVFLTGHYGGGHVEVQRQVAEAFRQKHSAVTLLAFADWQPLEGHFPANHAAHGETSFMLALAPDTVDLTQLPADRLTTLDEDGVWGDDPRSATAADGQRMVEVFVETVGAQMRALLSTAG